MLSFILKLLFVITVSGIALMLFGKMIESLVPYKYEKYAEKLTLFSAIIVTISFCLLLGLGAYYITFY